MKIYYHISTNPNCNWEVGDEIEFGLEDNFMWKSFLEKGDFIKLDGEVFTSYKVVTNALGIYMRLHPIPIPMKSYHLNPIYSLKEAVESLRNVMLINRELAFESIRREFYPALPSRNKCIWLIPDHEQSLVFWRNLFGEKNQKVFKVSADGIIHRTSQEWLIVETDALNNINAMGHKYWQGEKAGSVDDEVLFIGKVRILERIY